MARKPMGEPDVPPPRKSRSAEPASLGSEGAMLPLEDELQAYLDGELDREALAALEEGLRRDPRLRKALAELRGLDAALEAAAKVGAGPRPGFEVRLRARIAREAPSGTTLPLRRWLPIAAAAAVVAAVALGLLRDGRRAPQGGDAAPAEEVAQTPPAKRPAPEREPRRPVDPPREEVAPKSAPQDEALAEAPRTPVRGAEAETVVEATPAPDDAKGEVPVEIASAADAQLEEAIVADLDLVESLEVAESLDLLEALELADQEDAESSEDRG